VSKGNPKPKSLIGKRNAAKSEVNLVAYNVRINPATIALIKKLQAMYDLDSQGEVITKAVLLLISQESATPTND